jgi:hypothetical protein
MQGPGRKDFNGGWSFVLYATLAPSLRHDTLARLFSFLGVSVTDAVLVAETGDLRRLPRKKPGPQSHAHGRGDVVIAERHAMANESLSGRQLVVVAGGEVIRLLIADQENDIAWPLVSGRRVRRLRVRCECRLLR